MSIFIIIIILAVGLICYLTHKRLGSTERRKSNLAHDIRSCLSVIKLNSEVAMLNPNLDPELKKALEGNMHEVERISKMVDKIRK